MQIFLLSILLGLLTPDSGAEIEPKELPKVSEWAEKLSKAYWNGEDRIFEIEATAPDKDPFTLVIADCQSKGFGTLSPKGDPAIAGIFSHGEDKGRSLYAQAEGEIYRMNMDSVFEPLNNLAALWGDLGGNFNIAQITGVNWHLYLNDDSISMACGADTFNDEKRSPWLPEKLLALCTEVIEEKDQIHFIYPQGRMTVDQNGILIRQEFMVGERQRAIRLVSNKPMKKWSTEKYFGPIDPEKVIQKNLGDVKEENLLKAFNLQIIRKLIADGSTAEALEDKEEEIKESLIQFYLPLIQREMDQRDSKLSKIKRKISSHFAKTLPKKYTEFQREFPIQAEETTYRAFLEMLKKSLSDSTKKFEREHEGEIPASEIFTKKELNEFSPQEKALAAWFNKIGIESYTFAVLRELLRRSLAEEIEYAE